MQHELSWVVGKCVARRAVNIMQMRYGRGLLLNCCPWSTWRISAWLHLEITCFDLVKGYHNSTDTTFGIFRWLRQRINSFMSMVSLKACGSPVEELHEGRIHNRNIAEGSSQETGQYWYYYLWFHYKMTSENNKSLINYSNTMKASVTSESLILR